MKSRNEFTKDGIGDDKWKEYCLFHFSGLAMQGMLSASGGTFRGSQIVEDSVEIAKKLLKQLDIETNGK